MMSDPVLQHKKQEKIWNHFQTVNPEVFEQAKPRMDFLIKQLSRKKSCAAPSSFDLESLSEDLSKYLKVLEIRKTVFVSFKRQSLSGKIKILLKLILAKCGEMIASPSLYFCAKKSRE